MKKVEKERYLPEFSIKQLMDVGAHFGHRKWYLNSDVSDYIWGERNGLLIIDLYKTLPLLKDALDKLYDIGEMQGKVLFVGTRKHISSTVKDAAERCAQFYINHRWLGGLLTNWITINKSINKLKDLEKNFENDIQGYTKKEISLIESKKQKMKLVFDGIKNMNGLPDLIIVLDVAGQGKIAIQEAKQKNIPIIGLVDTNCNPLFIDYPIPINDDSIKCMSYVLDLFVKSILSGIKSKIESNNEQNVEVEEINESLINEPVSIEQENI